ncbi:TetR/AcrR family transcriptional regulator [Mycobacterium ostraviense]|uniref:HTH tetR-type domain-containing protein n=1 Tax=Mycobacterium ostraviense TaxID=2738409 RepID=A0A163WUV0_9MYCO|nr:TetR/AcrR family transcriptional regulator [Mycobacterium ostraviense]KZS58710.1 hypothetical protein A4G28_03880 [Mycobacterium ostraviense]UGT93037.1 TetR/AcrR family transcriptional regulator [Mycobacterium ostraviense]
MVRARPADRFSRLISAAADTFVANGYRSTQMQDVADVVGVAKGTVYGYVEGKAALLGAVLRYADGIEPAPSEDDFPIHTPSDGALAGLVAKRLGREVAELRLVQALSSEQPACPVEQEVAEIIGDLYRRLARHRISVKVVDRCAPELPELAAVWFGQGRKGQVAALTELLRRRALHLPGPVDVVARTIVETCVLWAVHMPWDPAPADVHWPDDDIIAGTLAGLLTRGLLGCPDA